MSELDTRCGALRFDNPFVLASAPPTASKDMIRKAFSLGWGGAVTKTIKPDSLHIADVSPRFNAISARRGEIYGFENIELVSKRDVAYWRGAIAELKSEFPGKVLIASIMGDPSPSSWRDLAKEVALAGADAIELNFSCPHGMPEMGVGAAIGQSAEISATICSWVHGAVDLPLIVKLTPNVTDVRQIAKAVVAAGADMLAAINTVESLTGVDLDSLEPQPSVSGFSTYGGYSGKAVKPIGLRVVAQLASAVQVPIMGMGGVGSWEDAAEYIALGASVVQVCTEVMLHGFGIIDGLKSGLSSYLERKALISPQALRGLAVAKMKSHEELARAGRKYPSLGLESACVSCGKCEVACEDGGYGAIRILQGKPSFDYAKCDGCSLCSIVCPTRAIHLGAKAAAGAA